MNGRTATYGTVTRHEQCLGGLTFLVAIASVNNSSLLPGASFGQDIDLEAFLAPESTVRDSSNSEYLGWEAAAEGRSSTCTGSTPHAGAVSIMHKLQLTAPESFHIANHHNATLHHHRTENSSSVTYHVSCRKHHFLLVTASSHEQQQKKMRPKPFYAIIDCHAREVHQSHAASEAVSRTTD